MQWLCWEAENPRNRRPDATLELLSVKSLMWTRARGVLALTSTQIMEPKWEDWNPHAWEHERNINCLGGEGESSLSQILFKKDSNDFLWFNILPLVKDIEERGSFHFFLQKCQFRTWFHSFCVIQMGSFTNHPFEWIHSVQDIAVGMNLICMHFKSFHNEKASLKA